MIENIFIFAAIAVILYIVFTKNSVEGMITFSSVTKEGFGPPPIDSKTQYGSYDSSVSQKTIMDRNMTQTAQSLLKETEQYPRSRQVMLNILDSDLMRYYEVPPKMLNELRDLVASPTGDITKIRNQIKEIVEYQKNMK